MARAFALNGSDSIDGRRLGFRLPLSLRWLWPTRLGGRNSRPPDDTNNKVAGKVALFVKPREPADIARAMLAVDQNDGLRVCLARYDLTRTDPVPLGRAGASDFSGLQSRRAIVILDGKNLVYGLCILGTM